MWQNAQRYPLVVETDADGDATVYFQRQSGLINALHFANTDLAGTADITLTVERTGQAIWARSGSADDAIVMPRAQIVDNANAALTYDGTRIQVEPVLLCNDRVKVVIANGGNAKTGTLTLAILH